MSAHTANGLIKAGGQLRPDVFPVFWAGQLAWDEAIGHPLKTHCIDWIQSSPTVCNVVELAQRSSELLGQFTTLSEAECSQVVGGWDWIHGEFMQHALDHNARSDAIASESQSVGMTDYALRRELLDAWLKDRDITRAELARLLGVHPTYVSALLVTSSKGHRPIKEETARSIERALGMPKRYLDGRQEIHPSVTPVPQADLLAIPAIVGKKNGIGFDAQNALTWSRSALLSSGLDPDHIGWLDCKNNEMAPTAPAGAVVIVDTRDTPSIEDGRVYAINRRGQFILRRIHLTPNGYQLSTDSNPASTITMTEAEFASTAHVIGRIRMVVHLHV